MGRPPTKLSQHVGPQQIVAGVRSSGNGFAEADTDGDAELDFEEFLAVQSEAIRQANTIEEIRRWFDIVRGERDTITLTNFFQFSLSMAVKQANIVSKECSLFASFKGWDKDGSGFLDGKEWTDACEELGFGVEAHELFKSLDSDNSGGISSQELEAFLLQSASNGNRASQQLINTIAFSTSVDGVKAEAVHDTALPDTSSWVLKGKDAPALRHELRQLMKDKGIYVADLLRLFDKDSINDATVDDVEFHDAIRKLFGYKGPKWSIDALFASLDQDKSGAIGYDELFEFLRGRRHPLDARNKRVRDAAILPPHAAMSLESISWDVETLRILLKRMLERCKLAPCDLLSEWSKSLGSSEMISLTWREFKDAMQRMFTSHEELWKSELAHVTQQAYAEIISLWKGASGTHLTDCVDLVRLERWINRPTERPPRLEVVRRGAEAPPTQHIERLHKSRGGTPKRRTEVRTPTESARTMALASLGSLRNVRLAVSREETQRRVLRGVTMRDAIAASPSSPDDAHSQSTEFLDCGPLSQGQALGARTTQQTQLSRQGSPLLKMVSMPQTDRELKCQQDLSLEKATRLGLLSQRADQNADALMRSLPASRLMLSPRPSPLLTSTGLENHWAKEYHRKARGGGRSPTKLPSPRNLAPLLQP